MPRRVTKCPSLVLAVGQVWQSIGRDSRQATLVMAPLADTPTITVVVPSVGVRRSKVLRVGNRSPAASVASHAGLGTRATRLCAPASVGNARGSPGERPSTAPSHATTGVVSAPRVGMQQLARDGKGGRSNVSQPDRQATSAAQDRDALDALEEKWRTEPADLAEWANRATRTLALARKWKRAALEWEELARKEAEMTAAHTARRWVLRSRDIYEVVVAPDRWEAWDTLRDRSIYDFGLVVTAEPDEAGDSESIPVHTETLMRRWGRDEDADHFDALARKAGL